MHEVTTIVVGWFKDSNEKASEKVKQQKVKKKQSTVDSTCYSSVLTRSHTDRASSQNEREQAEENYF